MAFYDPFGVMDMFDTTSGANKDLNRIPGEMSKYYDPYIQAGQRQLPGLEQYYSGAMNDPGGMMNKVGAGYQQSPGFQFALQQALQGAGHASAAGGMAGSPLAQQQNMGVATGMANQDYGDYMDRALGLQSRGVSGSQGLYNTGFQASGNMADQISQMLSAKAGLDYKGKSSKLQGLTNIAGMAGGAAFGGI